MKTARRLICTTAVVFASMGMVLPRGAFAVEPSVVPASAAPAVTDIALAEGGSLIGQVVDSAGQPVLGEKVEIRSGEELVDTGKTDEEGYFRVSGLRGGVYYVAAAAGNSTIRAWSPGTAPPAAQPQLLVVNGTRTVRGFGQNLANPWILAAIAAAAIGIPLALDDDGNAS